VSYEYDYSTIDQMLDDLGLSEVDKADIKARYDPPRIQRHVAYTTYMTEIQRTIRNPIGWFKASIRGDWKAPSGFELKQKVFHFRVDADAWAEITKGDD
jgi:hypothetical protein